MKTDREIEFADGLWEINKLIDRNEHPVVIRGKLLELREAAVNPEEKAQVYLLEARCLAKYADYQAALQNLNAAWAATTEYIMLGRAMYRSAQMLALVGGRENLEQAYKDAQRAAHFFYHYRGTPEQCSWASALLQELDWRRKHPKPGWLRRMFHGADPTILVGPARW